MATRGGNPRITIGSSFDDKGVRDGEKALDRLEKAGGRASAGLRTSVGGAGSKMGVAFAAGITPMTAVAAGAGVLAGKAFVSSLSGAMDTEEANNKLQAQLGLNAKESARLGRIAGRVYASNYGDSLGEVNGAIKSVVTDIDGLRDASSSRLRGITGDVISVSKAFDQDLGGVTRAVGQMLRTGLADNAQEALNIVTVGFQSGADKSGDLLDTLNEYGTQFRNLGLDGKDATGLISQGLQAGARDADLVADSLKEFSIRAVDGSQTTSDGFKALGLDAEKMSAQIAKGGEPASKGLDQVLDRLRAIKDPVKQSQAAVALFGTQAEDLGKALYALDPSKAADGLNKVEGAARRVNTTMGQGTKSQLNALKREIEVTATSLAGRVSPAIGKAAGALTGLFQGARKGDGAFSGVGVAVDRVKAKISDWVTRNRGDINSVINAFKTVGRFAKEVFIDTVLPNVRRAMTGIGNTLDGLVHVIRGVVRLVSGLLSGDWKKAWSGAKEIVSGAYKAIKASVETLARNTWEIIKDLGPKLIKGIVKGVSGIDKALKDALYEGIKTAARELPGLASKALKGIGGYIADTVTGAIGGIGKKIGGLFGDGIGDGVGKINSSISRFGGGLMGARPSMAPVAAMASRFGLGVSSGRRPGAITSSGNRSYHSTGEALDIAGTPAGMLGFFRYMRNTWGPRLAELIYTPGGAGIHNGSSHTYTGQVAADHYDHVHVAIDTGAPGVGDGPGIRGKVSTFGPPLERAGTTASGVSSSQPGIALYDRSTLGKLFRVTIGGHTATLRQTDIGPAPWTGRKIDVTGAGARALGIDPSRFPTDSMGVAAPISVSNGRSGSGSANAKKTTNLRAPGPTSSAPDGVPRERPLPGQSSADIRAGRDPGALFQPFNPNSIKGLPEDLRPPGTSSDADSPDPPTEADYLNAEIVHAQVSGDKTALKDATQRLAHLRYREYQAALATADPRDDIEAAANYQSVQDALMSLDETTQEANRLAQQRLDVDQQIADNGRRMVAVAERTGDMQGMFLAWLGNALGAPLARGMQAAGTPGITARY